MWMVLIFWDVTLHCWVSVSWCLQAVCHLNIQGVRPLDQTFEDERDTFYWDIGNHLPSNTVSHPTKPESSITLLWKLQNSQVSISFIVGGGVQCSLRTILLLAHLTKYGWCYFVCRLLWHHFECSVFCVVVLIESNETCDKMWWS